MNFVMFCEIAISCEPFTTFGPNTQKWFLSGMYTPVIFQIAFVLCLKLTSGPIAMDIICVDVNPMFIELRIRIKAFWTSLFATFYGGLRAVLFLMSVQTVFTEKTALTFVSIAFECLSV